MKKHFWKILFVLALFLVAGGIFAGTYYMGGPSYRTIYVLDTGAAIYKWDYAGTELDKFMLHPKPNSDNMPMFWERDDFPKGKPLVPSLTIESGGSYRYEYFFEVMGGELYQYRETQQRGGICFAGECGFAKLLGYQFEKSQIVTNEILHDRSHTFHLVSGPVYWAQTKTQEPNNVKVYQATRAYGPYAKVSNLHIIEGKPVYVARTTVVKKDGSVWTTVNTYVLHWDTRDILVDCAVVNPPPAPPKSTTENPEGEEEKEEAKPSKPKTFVEVVKPFRGQLCGREVKIGLERLVEKSVKDGKEVTVEILHYSFDGKRFPIPAERKAPRKVVVSPNKNVAL